MTAKPSPGWAVELTGEKIDLDDLRQFLEPPFDPWVEDFEEDGKTKLLLRSKTWTGVVDSGVVLADAERTAKRLLGAMLLIHSDARPVGIGQIFDFRADGTRNTVIVAMTGHIKLSGGRVRGRSVSASPSPPEPSSVQRLIKSAEGDDERADLLDHLARATNWYDIYKAAEIIRRIAGGQRRLDAALASLKGEWARVWQTANCNRHAPDPVKFPLPPVPATLPEALSLILRAARMIA